MWAAANPSEASAQTGFTGGRDPALDALDEAFSQEQAERLNTPCAAAWIKRWPGIQPVAPAVLRNAWDRRAQANPNRPRRLSQARIGAFKQTLCDEIHLSIGIAVDAAGETLYEGRNLQRIDVGGRRSQQRPILRSAGARPDLADCTIQPCEAVGDIPNPVFKIVAGDETFMMTRKNAAYVLAGQRPGEAYRPISLAEIAAHGQASRELSDHAMLHNAQLIWTEL
ncbi:hypothetical protein [Sinorhizobium fredii]|uniref:hypothetical protein n=1 Tax=Rhizobium fredii TaxID=380 RepID=UPI000595618F|nr:hypothetical protein [Sinorhizobium fredii]WOS66203.1 hypothetical protein SFGR64A_21200 [Sinorhizobium fredii GR64]